MGVDTDHQFVVYGGIESFPTRHGKVLDFDSLEALILIGPIPGPVWLIDGGCWTGIDSSGACFVPLNWQIRRTIRHL